MERFPPNKITRKMKNTLLTGLMVLLGWGTAPLLHAAEPVPAEPIVLFRSGDAGSKYYRIPALVTTTQGTLLAVADRRNDHHSDLPNRIDLVVRRSTDNGRSWGPQIVIARHTEQTGYGDAAMVVDRSTGDILCIYASGCGLWDSTAEHPLDINLSRSSDDGLTWSAPERITPQIYGPGCDNPASAVISGAFAASGRALQLRDGTLLFAVAAHHTGKKWPPLYNYVCQSDDGGRSWRLLPTPASACGDESKLAELADGSWLISIRNPDQGFRRYAVSKDRGRTWSDVAEWRDLPDPACNGDLLRYSLRSEGASRDRLLHSIPADTARRRNVSVALSYDEGRTWPVRKSIWPDDSSYSALTRLADGSIGILWEAADGDNGQKICFTRLTIDWLTDGADDGR